MDIVSYKDFSKSYFNFQLHKIYKDKKMSFNYLNDESSPIESAVFGLPSPVIILKEINKGCNSCVVSCDSKFLSSLINYRGDGFRLQSKSSGLNGYLFSELIIKYQNRIDDYFLNTITFNFYTADGYNNSERDLENEKLIEIIIKSQKIDT